MVTTRAALRFRRLSHALIWLSLGLVSACSTPPPQWTNENPLALAPPVAESVAALLKDYRVRSPLIAISGTEAIDHISNFGLVVATFRTSYALQNNGLWATATTGSMSGVGSAGSAVTSEISLCGLLSLAGMTQAASEVPVLPTLPGPITATENLTWRSRTTALQTASPNICSPTSGSAFSLRAVIEEYRKGTVLALTRSRTVELACNVGAEAKPASRLAGWFRGAALAVHCTRTTNAEDREQLEYAFLIDSGLYVLLAQTGGVQSSKMHFDRADYRD